MPADPLLLSVRSGARASMPGMMDTILNLGLNDTTVQGVIAQTRQPALRLRLLPPLRVHVRRRRHGLQAGGQGRGRPLRGRAGEAEEGARRALRHRALGRRPQGARRPPSSRSPRSAPATASRTIRASSSGAPSGPSSPPGTTTAPSPTASSTASRTAGARRSTCRSWSTATAARTPAPASPSRATRPAARTSSTASSWSTPRARTWSAGVRTPRPVIELKDVFPAGLRPAPRGAPDAGARDARHAGLRVHRGARAPLHAADAQRQAHRPGRHPHRRGHGRGGPHPAGRGPHAGRAGAARAAAAADLLAARTSRRRSRKAA